MPLNKISESMIEEVFVQKVNDNAEQLIETTALLADKATQAKISASKKIVRKVTMPPSFTWQNAPISVYKNAIGEISTDFDLSKLQHVGAGKTYYVSPTGNDANSGLTSALPKATIHTTVAIADADIVILMDGTYFRNNVGTAGLGVNSKNVSIKAMNSGKVILSYNDILSWTLESGMTNTYKVTRSGVSRVFDASFIDEKGDYKELTLKSSIAEVEANVGSMFISGTIIYIHPLNSRVPDTNIRAYFNTAAGLKVTSNEHVCYLEGIEIHGGNRTVYAYNTAVSTAKLFAKDCKFKYASGVSYDVVQVEGIKEAYFQNCEAAKGQKDGFNYHILNGTVPNTIEVNCIGRDNGVATSSVNNGSTTHDGGKVIRVNGQYYKNYGSNVGDIGVGSQSWNLGCSAYESKAVTEDRYKSNFVAHSNAEFWIESCSGFDSLNGITIQDNAKMYIKDDCVIEGNKTIEATGQLINY